MGLLSLEERRGQSSHNNLCKFVNSITLYNHTIITLNCYRLAAKLKGLVDQYEMREQV